MLTDTALRNLKARSKAFKLADRDGMYVMVSPTGTITFRYDYRINGRRETLTIGRYGPDRISLAHARELCLDASPVISGHPGESGVCHVMKGDGQDHGGGA
jgi:hypothetical protein